MRTLPALPFQPFLRAAALEAMVLTGHLLLYPTGVRAERRPALLTAPASAGLEGPGPGAAPEFDPEADNDAFADTADDARASCGHASRTRTADAPCLLPTEGRAHPPVVLLHGFVDNRSVFFWLRRSLLKDGWRHVYALNHSLFTLDIRSAAERLAEQIEEVCAQTGHSRVDLIGHSLGGLTGRYFVQRLGSEDRVRTLVTLGTPHSGTRTAHALWPHPLVRQMRPRSSLIQELAEPVPDGCPTRFVSFWSDWDELMMPVESARLDHPDLMVRNVHVRGVGHLTLPVDRAVSARVREELRGEADSLTTLTDTQEDTSAGVA